ncbi:unnamed protein product [Choristocarpus tenellus]
MLAKTHSNDPPNSRIMSPKWTPFVWGITVSMFVAVLRVSGAFVIPGCRVVVQPPGHLLCAVDHVNGLEESPRNANDSEEIDDSEDDDEVDPSAAWLGGVSMNVDNDMDRGDVTVGVKRTLGVDYGTSRVGLAVSMGISPRPEIGITNRGDDYEVALRVVQVARGEAIKDMVVGLPLERNGTETGMCKMARTFATTLANTGAQTIRGSRVFLWDERFSSAGAKALLDYHGGGVSRKIEVDSLSACIILEHYFAEGGVGAEEVFPKEGVVYRGPKRSSANSAEESKRKYDEARAKSLQAAADFKASKGPRHRKKRRRK